MAFPSSADVRHPAWLVLFVTAACFSPQPSAAAAARTAFCGVVPSLPQRLHWRCNSEISCRDAQRVARNSLNMMAAPAEFEGIYDFTHPGGTFQVHLRPGAYFCVDLHTRFNRQRVELQDSELEEHVDITKVEIQITPCSCLRQIFILPLVCMLNVDCVRCFQAADSMPRCSKHERRGM
jgi:hypothetical protein